MVPTRIKSYYKCCIQRQLNVSTYNTTNYSWYKLREYFLSSDSFVKLSYCCKDGTIAGIIR